MSSVPVFQNEKVGNRVLHRCITLNEYLEDDKKQQMRKGILKIKRPTMAGVFVYKLDDDYSFIILW